MLDVIQKAAPEAYEKRTKRQGIVNAWDDPDFAQAVRNTGKKHLIVAGVTTDVCLVPPALSMQEEGFHIKVEDDYSLFDAKIELTMPQCVLDAGGSPTDRVEQIAWERLKQAGIPVTSTNAVITELIKVIFNHSFDKRGTLTVFAGLVDGSWADSIPSPCLEGEKSVKGQVSAWKLRSRRFKPVVPRESDNMIRNFSRWELED